MDLFFGIGNIIVGLIMTLIGFKIYNPHKGNGESEESNEQWFNKYGKLLKFGGLVVLIIGIFKVIDNL